MDWDHLRFFLMLARHGSYAGAARVLGVEHTTVARRVRALEGQLGAALLVRDGAGLRLSEAGRQLLSAAEAMEAAVLGVERAAPSASPTPTGLVRIGCTEGLGIQLLAPRLGQLTVQYPQLSIDLLALPRLLHLSRREADLVISLERPQRSTEVVTRLADYQLFLYGEREYLARRPLVQTPQDLRHHAFISYVDDLLFTQELQFLDQLHPPERFAFRSTSVLAQYEAARAGAGLAVLPAFLADRDPVLQRVLPEQACFTRTFWMSMPGEQRHVPRMQVVWRFVKEVMEAQRLRLHPWEGGPSSGSGEG